MNDEKFLQPEDAILLVTCGKAQPGSRMIEPEHSVSMLVPIALGATLENGRTRGLVSNEDEAEHWRTLEEAFAEIRRHGGEIDIPSDAW